MKTLSTTALSKLLGVASKDLFDKLVELQLIQRTGNTWNLTEKGKEVGGQIVPNEKYGDFIAWPEGFNPYNSEDAAKKELINATKLGEILDLSNRRINMVLAEIGWIEKGIKGWKLTGLGKNIGGLQREHQSGGTFVLWPSTILKDPILLRSINADEGSVAEVKLVSSNLPDPFDEFRGKFPATFRTKDGHLVRSRAEVIIDNALYDYGLAHAYERKLPIEENLYSDFYIPSKNTGKAVYIEYWGMEKDDKYAQRMKIKKDTYRKHNLNLIELTDSHIMNLDDHLPKFLLGFGINVD